MIAPRSRRSQIHIGEPRTGAGTYSVTADPADVHDAQRRLERCGLRRRHAILLIHGWNVMLGVEAASFDPLIRNLDRINPDIGGAVLAVSWPSKGHYWTIARTAATAAAAVAAKIAREDSALYRTEELVVIAHSMGCAVALELCEALRKQDLPLRPSIRLFLMAAAVPVSRVRRGGRLRDAAESCARTHVYHSHFDLALGLPFRVGEWMATGERGAEAVGEYGRPADAWHGAREMECFGHGDYWVSPDIARDVVEEILSTVERHLPRRPL